MRKSKYNLGFISDELIFQHVKETVLKYKTAIDLKDFTKNVVDPIKLTFDSKIYGRSFEEIIDSECIRQIDKANTNHIGFFHQNLFKLVGNGWTVPEKGFDVVNEDLHIYVEIKNKHNTMNSASSQSTFLIMLNKVASDPKATCMLVETIASKSQNIEWGVSVDYQHISNERVRRVSMDKFYEFVFNDKLAFYKLCNALPIILDDVIKETQKGEIENSVYKELQNISSNTLKSLYLLAFKTYEGFQDE